VLSHSEQPGGNGTHVVADLALSATGPDEPAIDHLLEEPSRFRLSVA
jgi:hypothetical protein